MYDPNELDAKIAKSHINAEKVEEEAKASLADCEGVLENAKEKFADFQKDVKGVTRRFSEQKERLKVEKLGNLYQNNKILIDLKILLNVKTYIKAYYYSFFF